MTEKKFTDMRLNHSKGFCHLLPPAAAQDTELKHAALLSVHAAA